MKIPQLSSAKRYRQGRNRRGLSSCFIYSGRHLALEVHLRRTSEVLNRQELCWSGLYDMVRA